MTDVRELRIGNYVRNKKYSGIWTVSQILPNFIEAYEEDIQIPFGDDIEGFEGIKITPELLEKFGFDDNHTKIIVEMLLHGEFLDDCFSLRFDSLISGSRYAKKIKHVHQLQNLVYTITGGELRL